MSKVDRRILKSKQAIQISFLTLLMQNGFDEITVKDLADQANIARKTFYLHYLDKYDLLDQVVDEHLAKLRVICDQKKEKKLIEGTIIWFNYFNEHKAFFQALFKSKSTLSFREKLLDFTIGELEKKIIPLSNINKNIDQVILLKFLGIAVMGIIESFVLEEISRDTTTVAKQVGELVQRNI
ncbi:hypothetical protein DOK67_0000973 [Enterococcus sp. DIV0212c]|uniref:TetR/AcrR family transcriptional regulator n=1 Tax=Enterococcus sp. DIV0212c TaxID=2230867 RepID=UPI001A9BCD18|nr:TetR/AcrR family transcriptional regulator [Enterococcus sp. DIV0212c]MBO1352672.1 TetR/AcrR family transcriptional regulator [Enterococcus sp. DIV0212c]